MGIGGKTIGCGCLSVVIVGFIIIGSIASSSNSDKDKAVYKATEETTIVSKTETGIDDLYVISDFKLEYHGGGSDLVDYSFSVQNKSNTDYKTNAISFVLYVYDNNNNLLSSVATHNSRSFNKGTKLKFSNTLQGISNADWGNIALNINGKEYTADSWHLNFIYGTVTFDK